MPVISQGEIIAGATRAANAGIESALKTNTAKLDSILVKLDSVSAIKTNNASKGNISIHSRNTMVWWNKQEEAVRYILRLFIDGCEIDAIEINRNRSYYNFTDIVGGGYVVKLQVENRDGKITQEVEIRI